MTVGSTVAVGVGEGVVDDVPGCGVACVPDDVGEVVGPLATASGRLCATATAIHDPSNAATTHATRTLTARRERFACAGRNRAMRTLSRHTGATPGRRYGDAMERLPNWLTWARLAAVPIVMALLAIDDGQEGAARWWALGIFFVACMTDFLDGYLARRWHVITSFGKLADPIADKALVLGTLFMLCLTDSPRIPWWPLAIIFVREVAVTVGRIRVASHVVIPASRGGKVKTMVQLFAIGFYLIPNMPEWIDTLAWWLLVAAVILSVATWIDYEMRLSRARKESARAA